MTVPPDIDALDDHLLQELYDAGSLLRGRTYALEERVTLLGSGRGSIKAACRGSGRASYVLHVRWQRSGRSTVVDDSCSCPLGGGCKHCVAAILTARRAGAAQPAAPRPTPSAWRTALAELTRTDIGSEPPVELALQIAVERRPPSRWNAGAEPRLTTRPMRRGKGGRWIKTGASWRDVASPYGPVAGAEPRQRAALRALLASSRVGHYPTTETIHLDLFGADLWYQLERVVDAGIDLIGTDPGDVVELAPTAARVTVDLTADAAGVVTVSSGCTLDERPVPLGSQQAGLVGTPPSGVWHLDGGRLRLIRLVEVMHSSVARLVTGGPLTVPAEDVDELLDVYHPTLALHATVGSSDGSITITPTELDGVVLVVDRPALDVAALRWVVRYHRGARITDHPLRAPAGRGRDRAAEAAALASLDLPTHLLADIADVDGSPADVAVSGPAVITLLTEVLPWLEAKTDVITEVHGDQPVLREADDAPRISFAVSDGEGGRDGNDWFDLDAEVTIDGEVVEFVPLFQALDRDDEVLILPSGTWLRLGDHPELERLRDLIREAQGLADPAGSGQARVNRFQASWWEELAELGIVSEQSERWADAVQRMRALVAPEPLPPPAGLRATLRPYQQEGFQWLAFLHRNGLGGILADDMGLGKTVQTLALVLHVLESDPRAQALVVAPTSVVDNWAREAARFAPGVAVRAVSETAARRRTTLAEEIDGAQLVVTSYALFRLEFDAYAGHDWELLLLDEAQFVKNHRSKSYACARRLRAATKVAITGTPLENTLMDLWSLLSITAPGLYPDPKRFANTYRKPIERGAAPELLATLRRRIAPLMRRRTKDAVLAELPPKTEQTIDVELSPRHARVYERQLQRQRQKVLGLVGDVQKHRFEILKSLTILRQLALDPGLVDAAHDGIGSAKLDRLVEDLTQVVAEGHRALVFSQFTRYLARVRARLDAAGVGYSYLDGRTRKRAEAIARFKDGDAPVFVISLKAGGFGLNLTEADYCFVLDPWWNPATETQAVDRAHRIGQENRVVVYRYVSTHTIEEKVMELKARKADLFSSVMDADGGALAGALSEADIRGLLDLA